jgi:hypothetical protein
MRRYKQTLRSIGLVLLAALALVLILALAALAVSLVGAEGFGSLFWRLCSAAGGLALLLAAVLLLTNNFGKRANMRLWAERFPGLSFPAAVVIVGVWLVLCAGAVNYAVS